MLFRAVLGAIVASGLLTPGAQATLKQYRLDQKVIDESFRLSPQIQFSHTSLVRDSSYAVVEEDGSGNPRLKKFRALTDNTLTRIVPEVGGTIFISARTQDGPSGEFTGTGSADTTIAWGVVTGWTVTGQIFCHASPSFVCSLAGLVHDATRAPQLPSPFYDLGTWTFHGTGFVSSPYLQRTFNRDQGDLGNSQRVTRGRLSTDDRIPALPLFAVACLGGSLAAGGAVALDRGSR